MKKICSQCKDEKDLDDFYTDRNSKSGKTSRCKICMSSYRESKKEKSVEYMRILRRDKREKVNQQKRDSWAKLRPDKRMFQQAKNRATRKKMDFTIELSDIILPEFCPLLEIPFVVGRRNDYEHTWSLDRIDVTKGYVKGNVMVVSKKANSMKNSGTLEELKTFCKNMLNIINNHKTG